MTFGGASVVLGWLFLQASILIRAKITSIQKDQISSMIKNYCYYFSKITTKFRDEDDEHNWFILSHVTHKNSWIPVLLLVLSRPRSDHSFSWRRFCLLLMHCYLVVVLEKKNSCLKVKICRQYYMMDLTSQTVVMVKLDVT